MSTLWFSLHYGFLPNDRKPAILTPEPAWARSRGIDFNLMTSTDPDEQYRRNAATLLALVGMVLAGLALLGLAALVIPDILNVLLVLAGLLLIGLIQYLSWGWILDRDRIQDDD